MSPWWEQGGGLLDKLIVQIAEAKQEGAKIRAVCASQPTVVAALTEGTSQPGMRWTPPYEIFGYKVEVLDLPHFVWVLAMDAKPQFQGLWALLGTDVQSRIYFGHDLARLGDITAFAAVSGGRFMLDDAEEQAAVIQAQIDAGLRKLGEF